MKILLTVDPEIPVPPKEYGGIERVVFGLTKQLVSLGHDITLCANPASEVPCTLIGWPGLHSQDKIDTIKNAGVLTKLAFKNEFDIVHSFSRLAYMTAILPTAIPKIMSYQREPTLSQVKKANLIARKKSLVFTGCSNYISQKIGSIAEAYTIYNGVPVSKSSQVSEVETDAPLVFLGRIEAIKGTHIAIQVAQQANRKLIIAGNIPLGHEAYFEKNIIPQLSDRVEYIGPVNDAGKNELLSKALALLMPICWNEPFGIVMAEAMACGTPVLGFNRGSVPEVIRHGVNGFISENAEEMASQVGLCKNISREEVRRIAIACFSIEKISMDYLELYRRMIAIRRT